MSSPLPLAVDGSEDAIRLFGDDVGDEEGDEAREPAVEDGGDATRGVGSKARGGVEEGDTGDTGPGGGVATVRRRDVNGCGPVADHGRVEVIEKLGVASRMMVSWSCIASMDRIWHCTQLMRATGF